jgi:hypothetical protein
MQEDQTPIITDCRDTDSSNTEDLHQCSHSIPPLPTTAFPWKTCSETKSQTKGYTAVLGGIASEQDNSLYKESFGHGPAVTQQYANYTVSLTRLLLFSLCMWHNHWARICIRNRYLSNSPEMSDMRRPWQAWDSDRGNTRPALFPGSTSSRSTADPTLANSDTCAFPIHAIASFPCLSSVPGFRAWRTITDLL